MVALQCSLAPFCVKKRARRRCIRAHCLMRAPPYVWCSDRPRSGKGPKSYSQGQGVFSQGFGTDQVTKPKKASVRLPASGKRTDFSDIRVKKESVDEIETSSSIKRGKSSKAAMDVDGFSKFEPPSSSDEEDGAGGDPASLFPHTEEEALPIRLPLGSSQHSTAHDDVSDFPQPPPGKADFVFLQLPTLAPDIEAQDRKAPVDEMTVDTEEEVVSLAEALAGKQDGQIGTLRIRASGKAELVLGDDVYMFQKGTSIDCVQNVATVHTGEGKMVCLGTVPPEQRYLVIRDLNKAMADLDTSGSRN
eukprot:m.40925 g.40925  ORF g.40925 m.40925 type:complete len:304 (+) comp8142_c0_seq2:391-1302(+)